VGSKYPVADALNFGRLNFDCQLLRECVLFKVARIRSVVDDFAVLDSATYLIDCRNQLDGKSDPHVPDWKLEYFRPRGRFPLQWKQESAENAFIH
jgi:hypothetical protein